MHSKPNSWSYITKHAFPVVFNFNKGQLHSSIWTNENQLNKNPSIILILLYTRSIGQSSTVSMLKNLLVIILVPLHCSKLEVSPGSLQKPPHMVSWLPLDPSMYSHDYNQCTRVKWQLAHTIPLLKALQWPLPPPALRVKASLAREAQRTWHNKNCCPPSALSPSHAKAPATQDPRSQAVGSTLGLWLSKSPWSFAAPFSAQMSLNQWTFPLSYPKPPHAALVHPRSSLVYIYPRTLCLPLQARKGSPWEQEYPSALFIIISPVV